MRRLLLSALLLAVLLVPLLAGAQTDERRIDVVDISGPLDDGAVDFVIETIRQSADRGSEAVILELDSRGVVASSDRFEELVALTTDPPLPLVVWAGPAPGRVYGGALDLLAAAPLRVAAPGVEVGYSSPTYIAGDWGPMGEIPTSLESEIVVVDEPIPGLIDDTSPAIRQLIQDLDGVAIPVGGTDRVLSTLTTTEIDGEEQTTAIPVTFHKPGYWARFLRLAVTPEAAFMFLVAGLTVAAFEFYAIGPGIAAAMAAISIFLASYGLATLPVRWWALVLALAGWAALTASYQRGSVAAITGLGTLLMLAGGLWFVDGAPQLEMNPVVTAVIVLSVLAFYTVAMPTVARSRFSTRTIGREHLIGSRGVALVDLDPDGEVEVEGARWRASAHREAGIHQGDSVRVAEIDGMVLEVEPLPTDA
ncbi:MAG TPA: NfeD family protein [Acidimicrobiia bacterium]|nr:NfeD family protein [Acidimicrobiia bacterium]